MQQTDLDKQFEELTESLTREEEFDTIRIPAWFLGIIMFSIPMSMLAPYAAGSTINWGTFIITLIVGYGLFTHYRYTLGNSADVEEYRMNPDIIAEAKNAAAARREATGAAVVTEPPTDTELLASLDDFLARELDLDTSADDDDEEGDNDGDTLTQ